MKFQRLNFVPRDCSHFLLPVQLMVINSTAFFRCEICQIETTDAGGLQAHFAGKKHLKKMKLVNHANPMAMVMQQQPL